MRSIQEIQLKETHPFGLFVPIGATSLILGSFTTKEAFDEEKKRSYIWFYSNGGRNQFWPMLEQVYGTRLQTRDEMQELFRALGIALADIIRQCERERGSNLDVNLVNIVYAVEEITEVLENNPISKIFFTSRYVETSFRRVFKTVIHRYPAIELITLPSPSPRYVRMSREEKLEKYRDLLPPPLVSA